MNLTISEVEASASALFEALHDVPLSPKLTQIRNFLFPKGFTPVVQLEQDDRKKRGSAAASNWNAKSGEIRIYLDPVAVEPSKPIPQSTKSAVLNALGILDIPEVPQTVATSMDSVVQDPVTPDEVIECCQALAAAERSNRQFIALKWFRDDYLATVDFAWAKSPKRRQRVVSHAIDVGRIEARKIPNPRSDFPTTAISLNRLLPTPGVASRFQPITVRGEPVSTTLLRDRGNA